VEECLLSGVGFAIWARRTKRAAEAKASKVAVHYRDYPKGMQMCHMCKFYLAEGGGRSVGMCMGGSMGMMGAGACQVVEGRISPMGWCDLYATA
jgi:hypothetical protein